MAVPSSILWQNSSATVTLLDIPQSIANAQGTIQNPFPYNLLSTAPLSAPFPNLEPRSAKGKAKLLLHYNAEAASKFQAVHRQHHVVLQQAVKEIRFEYHASCWCLPRPFVEEIARSRKRRRLSGDVATTPPFAPAGEGECIKAALPNDLLPRLARGEHDMTWTLTAHQAPSDPTPNNTYETSHFISNSCPIHPASLQLQIPSSTLPNTNTAPNKYAFHIPPKCSFSLSGCTNSHRFRKSVSHKLFNFILLDPPWPNRSVRRTHKTPRSTSTYSIASTTSSMREMLLDLHLDLLMAPHCLVGLWITNKPAVRELVLGEGGLFDYWDVQLVEEWLWVKITRDGELVMPCDGDGVGVGRKPYEILLMGRRRGEDNTTAAAATPPRPLPNESEDASPERRVIFAVPDLHSRKPCLKDLVEPLITMTPEAKAEGTGYRALEVFARHLVAGWWSWGDECFKFNWDGCWRKRSAVGEVS